MCLIRCPVSIDQNNAGISQDLAFAISLCDKGAYLLCHDVSEFFPGVTIATNSLELAGVIKKLKIINTLGLYQIIDIPSWLINPSVFRKD